jgi:hypothetical protein
MRQMYMYIHMYTKQLLSSYDEWACKTKIWSKLKRQFERVDYFILSCYSGQSRRRLVQIENKRQKSTLADTHQSTGLKDWLGQFKIIVICGFSGLRHSNYFRRFSPIFFGRSRFFKTNFMVIFSCLKSCNLSQKSTFFANIDLHIWKIVTFRGPYRFATIFSIIIEPLYQVVVF